LTADNDVSIIVVLAEDDDSVLGELIWPINGYWGNLLTYFEVEVILADSFFLLDKSFLFLFFENKDIAELVGRL
jgi:predicted nucleotidyltransferase